MYLQIILILLAVKFSNSIDSETFINLALNESEKIDKLLSSQCYIKPPKMFDLEFGGLRNPSRWVFEREDLKTFVREKLSSNPDLCNEMQLCPKLRPWMEEKRSSEKENSKETPAEIQAKSYKDVPNPSEKDPLKMMVSFFIESISGFNEVDQEYGMGIFVRYEWNVTINKCGPYLLALKDMGVNTILRDDLLYKEKPRPDPKLSQPFVLKLDSKHYKLFWMPDIFMENAKSVSRQLDTFETNYLDLKGVKTNLLVGEKGHCSFKYTERYAATVPCSMNFRHYPIDSQHCEIRFRSYEYPTDQIVFMLKNQDLNGDIKRGLGDQYVNLTGSTRMELRLGHKFSIVSLELRFQRTMVAILVGTFVPSALIVSISFSSFWLGLDYLGDRINVGMICLLAVLAQFSQTRSILPPTAYVTFMDYWMILCIFSIVGQLLQTSVVYFVYNYQKTQVIKHKDEKEKKEAKERTFFSKTVFEERTSTARYVGEQLRRRRMSQAVGDDDDGENSGVRTPDTDQASVVEEKQNVIMEKLIKLEEMLFEPPVKRSSTRYIPMKIDSVTRVVFPSTFVLLTIVYWIILLAQRESKYHVF